MGEGCDLAATIRFVEDNIDEKDIAAVVMRASATAGVDRDFAVAQIAGRRAAASKLPSWRAVDGLVYPVHLSMEQCSSEATARYKTALVEGDSLLDITGGFGVDFAWMSRAVKRGVMVERQSALCDIARYNFDLLGFDNVGVVEGDGVEYLSRCGERSFDTIFVDPARRGYHGRRVVGIADCTPDVGKLAPILLACARRLVIIKLSPMLDPVDLARRLPAVESIHVVAVHGECKELLVVMRPGYNGDVAVVCINDDQVFQTTLGRTEPPKLWDGDTSLPLCLYEPNAAIMKAGCFGDLAARYGVEQADTNTHLFLSRHAVPDFPGRRFEVHDVTTMNKRELKEKLKGVDSANITCRNFPLTAVELRKRLKLKDGGDIYLMAATAGGRQLIFISRKI